MEVSDEQAPRRLPVFQRHSPGQWVLVASGPGFA